MGGLIGTVTSQKDGLASKEHSIFNKGNLRASELRTGFSYSSQDTPDDRNSAIISFAADGGFGPAQLAFTNTNELYFRIAWDGTSEWFKILTQ